MSADQHIVACPVCDAIHRVDEAQAAHEGRCQRCGHLLTFGRRDSLFYVVGLALTSFILLACAIWLPFLRLDASSGAQAASLIEVTSGFATGIMVPFSYVVLGFILFLPLTRLFLLLYALAPVALHRRALAGAGTALRWAFTLKPWAMAEIFMIGVAVAMVKLTGLADLHVGPAFWAFGAVVLISAFQETFMCRHTLWSELVAAR